MNATNVELIKSISRIMKICSPDADHLYSTLANLDDTAALKRVLGEAADSHFYELDYRHQLASLGSEFNLGNFTLYKAEEEKKKTEIPFLSKLMGT